jgi:hypothetical protein
VPVEETGTVVPAYLFDQEAEAVEAPAFAYRAPSMDCAGKPIRPSDTGDRHEDL